ncbi:MAG: hypothetical protein HYS57_01865, partial [Parcubacteria group bacterium]|nr:hypothetical protein [Parcubacteria group bacterium]
METHPVFLTKKFSVTVIILAVSLFSGRVLAYDQNETHPALTRYIGEFYNKVNPQNPLSREDVGSLAQGSVAEDNNARFIYHFYDPVNQKGLWGRNLSSRDWSQDIQAQAKLFGLAGAPMGDSTNQTWERAIFEHVKGNRQAAMYALGHVLHLIEDATVPEHVRNDAHTGAPGDPKSPFENWAKGERLTELSATVRGLSERVPSFGSLNEVFDETALYTNRNFFSEQTIGFGRGYILPDIQFFGKDEEAKNYFVAYGVEPGGELYRLAAKRTFVDDRQEWDQIEEPKFPSGFSLEHGIVMQDYWPRLSKKAIVNGAATIDLFFREAEKYKQNPELMAGWNKQSW